MAANILDSIVLFGDSLTEVGWMEGGFAHLLAGMCAGLGVEEEQVDFFRPTGSSCV